MMLNITMLGYPGSGKSINARTLARSLDLGHVEMGRILRNIAQDQSGPETQLETYLQKGALIPDDLATRIILEITERDCGGEGFVFDGFPRTVKQAFMLDEYLDHRGIPLPVALYLLVDRQTCARRIVEKRAPDSGREDDQSLEVVTKRIETQGDRIDAVADYYGERNRLYIFNAEHSIDTIQKEMRKVLGTVHHKQKA